MANKKKDTNDVDEEAVVIDESSDVLLVRRGQAVPVDPATGAPKLDAPAAVQITGSESTSHQLAKVKGSAESRQPSHVGSQFIGERP